jgi:hypothetical protein
VNQFWVLLLPLLAFVGAQCNDAPDRTCWGGFFDDDDDGSMSQSLGEQSARSLEEYLTMGPCVDVNQPPSLQF